MDDILLTIKEVQEGGKGLANWYLNNGYLLLDIQQAGRAQKFPEENRGGQQYFVRRNPIYILGRPDGVKPVGGPPPWVPPKKVSDETG